MGNLSIVSWHILISPRGGQVWQLMGEGAGGKTATTKQDKKVGGAESFPLFCIGKMFARFA